MKRILYVGMDVHKEIIVIACASEGEEIRELGTIANNSAALTAMVRKLISVRRHPSFVYETGPVGYVIYRQLRETGFHCMVAAPSLIPRKSGERVKTDRRDVPKKGNYILYCQIYLRYYYIILFNNPNQVIEK